MDTLNYECLEHIFSFLDYRTPKEWLLLSKVCTKWQDVVSRTWKKIDRIEIVDGFDKHQPYLSSKKVLAIIDHAAQHVTDLKIIKRDKINSIKLGEFKYNSNCLDMDAVLASFEGYSSGKLLKANVFPDNQKFLKYIMSCNKDLQQLTLTLDEHCFSCNHLDRIANKLDSTTTAELQLIPHENCTVNYCTQLCGQVMDSFPDLKTLAVMFTAVTRKNLDIVDRLLSALMNHPTAKEFHVNISDGTGIYEVISLISRYCCRKVMEFVQSEEYEMSQGRWLVAQLNFGAVLSLQKTPYFLPPLAEKSPEPKELRYKLTSLMLNFGSSLEYHTWRVLDYKVDEFCQLIDEIPSLQKLEVISDTYWHIQDVRQLREILLHATNMAIANKRRIVINELIEMVGRRNQLPENAETLVITLPLKMKSAENLRRFLQELYRECRVTIRV